MTPEHLILTIVLCCVSFILGGSYAFKKRDDKDSKEKKDFLKLDDKEYIEHQRKKLWDKINDHSIKN